MNNSNIEYITLRTIFSLLPNSAGDKRQQHISSAAPLPIPEKEQRP
jgi:hypothetical protein